MAMSQQVHLQGTEIPILPLGTMIDIHLFIARGTDIGPIGQDPIPAIIDTEVTVRVIHKEVTPGHTTHAHTEAYYATCTETHMAIDRICHMEDLHHTEVFPHIPETTVGLNNIHHTEIPT